ncbi:hypothetical protein CHMI_00676 [Cellulomonas hominis]|nr:hypothetical protein CHMI_00676 [Cellulomonas hominis]
MTWYAVAMMMNAVPLLNSDGYRVLLAACGVTERREVRQNPPMVRLAAGASVVVAVGYAAALGIRLIGAFR